MATRFISQSADETEAFAEKTVAPLLRGGDVIACRGGMGMGKTAFTRGLARGLGLTDYVSSPTFALVHEYTHGNTSLFHFDMYRISGVDELYSTGFFDYLGQDGIMLIEWSENIEGALPPETITLTISHADDLHSIETHSDHTHNDGTCGDDMHSIEAHSDDMHSDNTPLDRAPSCNAHCDDTENGDAQLNCSCGDENIRVLTLEGGRF